MNTDITFIIPCHNLEDYISPLLKSFQMLDLENLNTEFIFVLDACTDHTEDKIYQDMYPFIFKILYCDHHSCGFARNEALNVATGEYIWFIDGDDWIIYPKVVQECLSILKSNNASIIQILYISNYFKNYCPNMVWQYIMRRDLIGSTRFLQIQPHEDLEFMREILEKLNTNEILRYSIPSYFYNYKRPGSNMTRFFAGEKI